MVVDSLQAASAVAGRAQAQGEIIPALIEIDCDGHRAGVQPGNTEQLLAIARELHGAGCLRGVMTHAGESMAAAASRPSPTWPSRSGGRR